MSELIEEEDSDKARSAIVERYKRGPDGPIEPWEDASFIIYKVIDRFGFLHKNPLPQFERDEKALELERERSKKWLKMFANWSSLFQNGRPIEKLRRRIYKGIPDNVRGEAWKKILNLEKVIQPGVYDQFCTIALQSSPDIRQIDLDVNRTYRDHIMFRDRFSVKQQALFNILAAYSMYNTDVGYCQGMSGIAALLLMYMNEEDAFWALSELLTDRSHAMHGLFIPEFPKLHRFQNHHDTIMRKMMPKLQKHLEKEGVFTSLYSLKWFMQVFLDRLPFSLVLRVYDIYMIDGEKVITAMAYHILKLFKKSILKMDLEKIAPFLQEQIVTYNFNDDEVIETLQESMNELRKSKLDKPPPPASNELPVNAPGTLPQRNSYITASKRARMAKQTNSLIEVPMGRPPSPNLKEMHQNGAPATLEFKGVKIQQNKSPLMPPSKQTSASSPALPTYDEHVLNKSYLDESVDSNLDVKISKEKPKDNRKHSDTRFYVQDHTNAENDNQKWSYEVTSNNPERVSIYDNDSPRNSYYTEYGNGHSVVIPPPDYNDEPYIAKNIKNSKNKKSIDQNVKPQYATETRL